MQRFALHERATSSPPRQGACSPRHPRKGNRLRLLLPFGSHWLVGGLLPWASPYGRQFFKLARLLYQGCALMGYAAKEQAATKSAQGVRLIPQIHVFAYQIVNVPPFVLLGVKPFSQIVVQTKRYHLLSSLARSCVFLTLLLFLFNLLFHSCLLLRAGACAPTS